MECVLSHCRRWLVSFYFYFCMIFCVFCAFIVYFCTALLPLDVTKDNYRPRIGQICGSNNTVWKIGNAEKEKTDTKQRWRLKRPCSCYVTARQHTKPIYDGIKHTCWEQNMPETLRQQLPLLSPVSSVCIVSRTCVTSGLQRACRLRLRHSSKWQCNSCIHARCNHSDGQSQQTPSRHRRNSYHNHNHTITMRHLYSADYITGQRRWTRRKLIEKWSCAT